MTKFMTSHHRIPHVSIVPTMERNLIIDVEEKFIVLPFLWSDDNDIETIQVLGNSHLDQRSR